ncbi:L-lactate dehydrogenase complex protein LldG [Sphingomonas jinjuensis]|uniref:L-lactate dehydrogenase complex protein LldG n=1 Tax=Sphingomonas jinjuensis TaxID=535907 RepID=A0A840FF63_9SPHN|nr:L-lactate dehydrogenase complex protein LldG [Sphingomonas jinjuensis]
MSARDAILAALGPASGDDLDRAAAALLIDPERPPVDPTQLEETFAARLLLPSVAASYAAVAGFADVPAAIAAYCAEHGLPRHLCAPPDPRLDAADWSGIDRHLDPAPDEPLALAVAECGVAETGSLVMRTAPTAPMLPNFLALHHVVVVPRLVAYLEDALPTEPMPRGYYWITGVSGTTDIEGTYVRGAHGPRYLHVIRLISEN